MALISARIAVTGAGSLFGQGILKSLRCSDFHLNILGLDYFSDAFGFRYCDHRQVLPDLLADTVSDDTWFDALKSAVMSHGSRVLFVGADFEVLRLAHARASFENETGCRVIVVSEALARDCKDKLRTAVRLAEAGLAAPVSSSAGIGFEAAADLLSVPFVIKPRDGARGRGVRVVHTNLEFEAALERGREYIVQQYLPDASAEYSCGVLAFPDRIDAVTPLCRELRDGNTWSAVARPRGDSTARAVEDYCRSIATALGADGPLNVQCRIHGGVPIAFEINPRFSGTTFFRTLLGVNEPERVVKYCFREKDIGPPPALRPGRVRRFFDECVEEA